MKKKFLLGFAVASWIALAQSGGPAITTGQYNTSRTAANTNETILTPSNVKFDAKQFGKLASYTVDGEIFAQPLYVPGVNIGGITRNVVYVATMHNTVYAFDAGNPGSAPLWSTNLGGSVTSFSGTSACPSSWSQGPELGILSTPVIDPTAKTLYVVSASPGGTGYVHYIHALDITTGQKKQASVLIQASVSGSGYNNRNGTVSLGSDNTEVQRTALLLANGTVYAGFGNCGPDVDPWHGWVVGYNASNLQRTVVFNSTPNGGQGGIWQSGRGLVADTATPSNIYLTTGNATVYNSNDSGVTTGTGSGDAKAGNYPMRVVQLNSTGGFLGSWPPPDCSNQQTTSCYSLLNNYDLDFSSSGPLLIPGTSLMAAGGKDGMLYVFNTANFGSPVQNFQATGSGPCNPTASDTCNQIHDLAFWNNHLYIWGSWDVLRSIPFNGSTFSTSADHQNTLSFGYRPPLLAVSGNGTSNGIVWAITPDSIFHAYDASNVATELWNSNPNSSSNPSGTYNSNDALPSLADVRFVEPTVANGRVYVPTGSKQLVVYGLLSQFSVSASPSSQSVQQGNSTSFTVNVSALAGFNGTVNLSLSGLPANATASFNPSSVNGSGSSTLTITTTTSTPTGTSSLVISAAAPGINQTRTANASLTVTSWDTTPPTATCCTYTTSGSSYVLHFTGQDTGTGMQSITPSQMVNATPYVPPFQVGTTSVINFTATESGWGSYAQFKLMDVAGNTTFIDPVIFDPERQPGPPVPFAVKNICKANACTFTATDGALFPDAYGEGTVTIQNGSPGLKNLRIEVSDGNGDSQKYQVAGLKDGEVRVVDISASLPNVGPGTVSIIPLGKPDGAAMIIFGPGPISPQ